MGDDRISGETTYRGLWRRIGRALLAPRGRTRLLYLYLGAAFVYFCLIHTVEFLPWLTVPLLAGIYLAIFVRDGVWSVTGGMLTILLASALVHGPDASMGAGARIGLIAVETLAGALGALAGSLSLGFGERWGQERFFSAIFLASVMALFAHGCLASHAGRAMGRGLDYHPEPGTYAMDAAIFLRTFLLMERGEGYYEAMVQSIREDGRGLSVQFPQNVRLPTLFTLWSISFPNNGRVLQWAYVTLATAALWVGFKALRQIGAYQRSMGLLGAVALIPYLRGLATTPYLLFPEAWAIFPAMVALWWYGNKKRERAALAGGVAALIRETFGTVPLAGLVASLICGRRKRALVFAGVLAALALVYAAHVAMVRPHLPEGSRFAVSLQQWAHPPSVGALHSATSFAMGYYPGGSRGDLGALGGDHIPWPRAPVRYVFIAMALIGVWKMRNPQNRWYAWGLILFPALLILFAVPNPVERWGEYWGMTLMPAIVLLSPLALRKRGPGWPPRQGKPQHTGGAVRAGGRT